MTPQNVCSTAHDGCFAVLQRLFHEATQVTNTIFHEEYENSFLGILFRVSGGTGVMDAC